MLFEDGMHFSQYRSGPMQSALGLYLPLEESPLPVSEETKPAPDGKEGICQGPEQNGKESAAGAEENKK